VAGPGDHISAASAPQASHADRERVVYTLKVALCRVSWQG
jgi:hypothetical protein